ncbi:transposon Ty3-I Gag-Pol polyprotein [Trichonephila inaurata madagascariensis]|uniref:Transposon Ty3-I Gag-Pol polyprotein n=1 Tax=Trichonephila inaurata madagascariensis TaxID=2747483 RepID=A0A8X6YLA3_9ARAC|nr:transposon Ty3-I Gag-Pol polyprotein [Trichonephila inaurata madagascariensis]
MKGSGLINSSIVLGIKIIGKGFSAGKKLCAFLGLPFLSKLAFRNQERKLLKATERVAQENVNAALSEIKGSNSFTKCGISIDDGTARKWYKNNEDSFTSWTLLENGLKAAFGDTQTYVRRARDHLKSRAQQPWECIQSYIQDVLELCKQAEPSMSEEDKVSHLMKGVTEDLFQALLTRDVQASGDFTRWCLHIEEMKQKRPRSCKFERLPNFVPIAANDEVTIFNVINPSSCQGGNATCVFTVTQHQAAGIAIH